MALYHKAAWAVGLAADRAVVVVAARGPTDLAVGEQHRDLGIGQHRLPVPVQIHQPPFRAVEVSERDLAQLLAAAFRQAAIFQGEHLAHVPARAAGRIARALGDDVGNDLRTVNRQRLHLNAVADHDGFGRCWIPQGVQHGSRIHEAGGSRLYHLPAGQPHLPRRRRSGRPWRLGDR